MSVNFPGKALQVSAIHAPDQLSTKYNVNERKFLSFLSGQISDLKLTWWNEKHIWKTNPERFLPT